jgi:hypothetical protein
MTGDLSPKRLELLDDVAIRERPKMGSGIPRIDSWSSRLLLTDGGFSIP